MSVNINHSLNLKTRLKIICLKKLHCLASESEKKKKHVDAALCVKSRKHLSAEADAPARSWCAAMDFESTMCAAGNPEFTLGRADRQMSLYH